MRSILLEGVHCMSVAESQRNAKPRQKRGGSVRRVRSGIFSHCGKDQSLCSIVFDAEATRRERAAKNRPTLAVTDGEGRIEKMAGNVVNLNRFRKKKQREEKAKQAEINRIRHGRTQVEKERERADRERAARVIEGKRLERATDASAEAEAPPAGAEDIEER